MVKDFIIDLVKLRNELITICPTKEKEYNKKITKVFKFLRECYEINNHEINSNEILKKIPNTTQTSYSLKKNNKKLKLTRNCIIHCELKINVLLKNEIKNEYEILKKVKTLVSNFLLSEEKKLSNDWDLIIDKEKLRAHITDILNMPINKNDCDYEIEITNNVWDFFKKEINSNDLQYNPSKTSLLHLKN